MSRSTSTRFPVRFIPRDITDPAFLALAPALATSSDYVPLKKPPLTSTTSLNELHGKVSAIFAEACFHLASMRVSLVLSRIFLGGRGLASKGLWTPGQGTHMHGHSTES